MLPLPRYALPLAAWPPGAWPAAMQSRAPPRGDPCYALLSRCPTSCIGASLIHAVVRCYAGTRECMRSAARRAYRSHVHMHQGARIGPPHPLGLGIRVSGSSPQTFYLLKYP